MAFASMFESEEYDAAASSEESPDKASLNEEWLGEDLEQAYRRVLEANEAIEWEYGLSDEEDAASDADSGGSEATTASVVTSDAEVPTGAGEGPLDHESLRADDHLAEFASAPDETVSQDVAETAADDRENVASHAQQSRELEASSPVDASRVSPKQVVEAALFVGGRPLTTKKLNSLMRGESDQDAVERAISELNQQYVAEGRPYEISLGEGGYRMALLPEFDRIRNRVFGLGPKEIRLSQDALEVLALVAYRQSVTRQDVEAAWNRNPGGTLQQLIRRELVVIQREGKSRKDVKYLTSPRLLSLFGLGSLEKLPQADEFSFR